MIDIKKIILESRVRNTLIASVVYFFYYYLKHPVRFSPLNKKTDKSSDTLFILGCGPSINELTESDYEKINKFDVVSMSYSIILPVKVKYYFYESPQSKNSNEITRMHRDKLLPIVREKHKSGYIENILWKNPEQKTQEKKMRLHEFTKIWTLLVLSENIENILQLIKILHFMRLDKLFLIQKRSSLVSLIIFGILSGYKKIVLSGIDLSGTKYFFEGIDKYNKYGFTNPYEYEKNHNIGDEHLTNDPSLGITTEFIIESIINEYPDTELMISSKKSKLSRIMSLWIR